MSFSDKIHFRRYKYSLIVLAAILLAGFAFGCGKKVWPKPVAKEDVFKWKNVQGEFVSGCVMIEAELEGNFGNISGVVTEWSIMGAEGDCPACPFTPRFSREYQRGSEWLTIVPPKINVQVCGFSVDKKYRFRMVGRNAYEELGLAYSDTFDVSEENSTAAQ